MKKMLATAAVGLAFSGIVGVGLSAGYATAAGAATPPAVSSAATPGHHPLRAWLRGHRRAVVRDAVQISARAIGTTPKDLVGALHSGTSIAQVARAHNVDSSTVVSALVKAGDAQISGAVDKHTLTPAEAARIAAALPGSATTLVDHVFGRHAG